VEVKFVDEVEEFVSETSLCTWWNQGVSKYALPTSAFLVRKDIAKRFGMLQAGKWRNTILDMLEGIPSIATGYERHYRCIDAKLTIYVRLQSVTTLLELALWKSKLLELGHSEPNVTLSAMEMQKLRMSCGAAVIIPNVLPFLLVEWPYFL